MTRGLDLAADAWRAIDRLAQLSPQELHEQRGVIMALSHKLDAMLRQTFPNQGLKPEGAE